MGFKLFLKSVNYIFCSDTLISVNWTLDRQSLPIGEINGGRKRNCPTDFGTWGLNQLQFAGAPPYDLRSGSVRFSDHKADKETH